MVRRESSGRSGGGFAHAVRSSRCVVRERRVSARAASARHWTGRRAAEHARCVLCCAVRVTAAREPMLQRCGGKLDKRALPQTAPHRVRPHDARARRSRVNRRNRNMSQKQFRDDPGAIVTPSRACRAAVAAASLCATQTAVTRRVRESCQKFQTSRKQASPTSATELRKHRARAHGHNARLSWQSAQQVEVCSSCKCKPKTSHINCAQRGAGRLAQAFALAKHQTRGVGRAHSQSVSGEASTRVWARCESKARPWSGVTAHLSGLERRKEHERAEQKLGSGWRGWWPRCAYMGAW